MFDAHVFMATIEKRGNSYRFRSSSGYTVAGEQVRASMTWTPDPGMTPKQIEKELVRQSTLFDEKVRTGAIQDNHIKFATFADKYMEDYGKVYLKPRPLQTYMDHLRKINTALGHIRLCDLKATHINSFYRNLQEVGARDKVTAICKIDLGTWLKEHKLSMTKFEVQSGVSRAVIKTAAQNGRISKESAEKMALAMNV